MPQKRSLKSDGRRDAIVEAAIRIINARGYARATMSDIAASLGLRDATLYYYFPNKAALAQACHALSLERFEEILEASAALDGSGAARLKHLIRGLIEDSFQKGPLLYFGDYSYLGGAERHRLNLWGDKLKGMLKTLFEQGMKDGSLVRLETELAVQLFVGMIIWLAKWAQQMEGLTEDRLYDAIVAMCLDGIEAQAAA